MKNKKQNYQKKILNLLSQKSAVSFNEINNFVEDGPPQVYAVTRSLKRLLKTGLIEQFSSEKNNYARITPKGKSKLNSIKLEGSEALVPNTWDGFWRIIILDIPEERKNEREALRYLLKKANFVCIKNTVWISPHPYENLFSNIKKDLGLSTELMIIVSDKLDKETSLAFLQAIKK